MNRVGISKEQLRLFKEGSNFKCYEFLGSRIVTRNKEKGVLFRLFAPNAEEVRVVGDFNNWIGIDHVMYKDDDSHIWFLFIPKLKQWDMYKYEIHTKDKKVFLKSDPFAFYTELRPGTASKISELKGYKWKDEQWIKNKTTLYDKPLNIYEVHLGSWKRDEDNNFYSYKRLSEELIDYVLNMGYTHIELLPHCEHPLDGSWGYQVSGYFSVTSRYGKPKDFMRFIDKCHEKGLGVILDWVPGHFCKDVQGLCKFDGTSLYEYEDPLRGENLDWGTANFDLGKPIVQNFLLSNAFFFFQVFHVDGIRVDAVASMLYLDYGKNGKHILKNKYGGNENLEAVDFFKKLNQIIFKFFPTALVIAEDSTAWPLVTYPTYAGGLGFNYKWNMGWMNDTLQYMEMNSLSKRWNHSLITFSIMYAFSENFILPLSHDEVVHGKKSLLSKMPGNYNEKFSNLRLFYGYMISHPGKKLLFMGGEFGQFIEWRYDSSLDWNLLDYPMHDALSYYVKSLNKLYKNEGSLWEMDFKHEGFSWIDHQNSFQSIISFLRTGKDKDDFIIVICNFTTAAYCNYKVGVPKFVYYKEILNSDEEGFGGTGKLNKGTIKPLKEGWHNRPYCVELTIPPLAILFIKPDYRKIIKEEKEIHG